MMRRIFGRRKKKQINKKKKNSFIYFGIHGKPNINCTKSSLSANCRAELTKGRRVWFSFNPSGS